jgi:4-diphosphocytidyl-2-C-methyl-D-erythritol kinase
VPTTPFTLPSFAKINWSLEILGRRVDGYHEIRTLLQTISLHDELTFTSTESSEIALSCDDPRIPLGEENLILRAANRLRTRSGTAAGANVHLRKRIPAQGGLGGGSSNAAVALLGLARLWNLEIAREELLEMSAELGADVPFFLVGGCVLAEGIGTDLTEAIDQQKQQLIVITPNATVSTASAYAALKAPALTTLSDDTILSSSRAEANLQLSSLCTPRNDFERVIFESEPEIERAQEALLKAGAISSLLAGSGSSVFGIFESKEEQERAVREMKAEPGWRVFPAVTVSRSEYSQALGF